MSSGCSSYEGAALPGQPILGGRVRKDEQSYDLCDFSLIIRMFQLICLHHRPVRLSELEQADN